ncbi:hypothetical protein BKA65DRAFT_596924 [Rhexocercosporidium sp. MPI-PUGE-AT-0058]|nr:hypothetical protein BKA65DRAFT_596924 [Rhexocercosporidium sp. MPI-PUGE-AT-0058]
MPPIPHRISVRSHPGSSLQDIENEPDWGHGHEHRIGFWNGQGRVPGLTHSGDEREDSNLHDEIETEEAAEKYAEFRDEVQEGKLVNFRDVINAQEDFHLRRPGVHSEGWRYVLNVKEDWIKSVENWPANVERKKKEDAAKKEKEKDEKQKKGTEKEKVNGSKEKQDQGNDDIQQEHEWKRANGDSDKHHDAYAGSAGRDADAEGSDKDEPGKTEYDKLREKYSPQEIALLRSLQHEKDYVYSLTQNDGKRKSPIKHSNPLVSIDEADQFGPDNWIPRSSNLIRLTGKHPLNGEPKLTPLFEAGLITPNEFHYVRNHGAVPHLLWELHKLQISGLEPGQKLELGMNELVGRFDTINIPVALACDGNRRKELNMIKRSKGFNWGSGAVSCAYWKGPLLRDVLLAAGIPDKVDEGRRRWVNFEGADEPSEGKYATCIPLDYAMDATNDVILAYEMNDVPLPPDHGHPVRIIIPGYVGGRCVKWLQKIWVSEKENDSHYHIWDNRVLPAFITEKDGEFADVGFMHPSTACNEQNLQSVIVKPAQGETIPLDQAKKGKTYRIEGYAYDGGGHEVQRVEISLDDGVTWLYCIRKFPEAPIRHGNKFWTWLHWHLDVEISHLVRCKSIIVRCFNVFKNTQPQVSSWNTMGMMNNCWYVVKPEIAAEDDGIAKILFRHPVEPGTKEGGWMRLSESERINEAKQASGAPEKQFTREEIEKHNTNEDCWIVVDGKVYDATSVLEWHPGGKAAITGHGGKVWQATTDEFNSIHDGYAQQKLEECILGVVTDKAANFIKKNAEKFAEEAAKSASQPPDVALQKHRWMPVKLSKRTELSKDTRRYTFSLPNSSKLGLETCQHIQFGFHFKDQMLIRSYTPTRPVRSQEESGTFDLVVKTYFPDERQPGGAMSNILDCIPIGEEVEIRGPTGEISYHGNGKFIIEGKQHNFSKVSLILGGSGITPGYALMARILADKEDKTQLKVIDGNKSEADILLKDQMQKFATEHAQQFQICHVLSHPSDDWKGVKGHVNEDMIKGNAFAPGGAEESVVFLCGPPAMIQKVALPALKDWGYEEERDCFGF